MPHFQAAQVWGITNPGRKPGPNQDRILIGTQILDAGHVSETVELPTVVAVADGISADPGGEIASQAALEAVRGTAPRSAGQALKIMQAAHARILDASVAADRERIARMRADPTLDRNKPLPRKYMSMRTMCTTIGAVWLSSKRIVWCARGDTPVYLVSKGQAEQVTTPDHDARGRLTSYLGADARVTEETTSFGIVKTVAAGASAVAVMSDGVSNFVPEDVLLDIIAGEGREISEIGRDLMHLAVGNGSRDNISFVMARLRT